MEKKEMIYYRLDEVDEKILAMLQCCFSFKCFVVHSFLVWLQGRRAA